MSVLSILILALFIIPLLFLTQCDGCADKVDTASVEDSACDDCDGDGYVGEAYGGDDCNDDHAWVHPDATDVHCDGIDQDCDGRDALLDADADGHDCDVDCDDLRKDIHRGAPELSCDGIDQDCDGKDWEADLDHDGSSCDDCDDSDPASWPGAKELACDGIDQDCDPSTSDLDLDHDGVGGDCGDCDDDDASRYPGAKDELGDGIDQDCDGCDGVCEEIGTVLDLVEGDLIINEILAKPAGGPEQEWFELWVGFEGALSLEGLLVLGGDGTEVFALSSPLVVHTGDHVVLGASSLDFVDWVYEGSDYTLSDDEDTLSLYDPEGRLLDSVSWSSPDFTIVSGASARLDPGHRDARDNDQPAFWCTSTEDLGWDDLGSPGLENGRCCPDTDKDGWDDCEDCDPGNALVNPGAKEIPGDGIDQDCDGVDPE